jgi:glucose-1-phosphate thymidylyltransferase
MVKTKGILLAGGKGTRLAPLTSVLNKHLIPIYDKPMIFYPLSTLMMCGIREIAVITNLEDVEIFRKLLGDGSQIGVSLEYLVQEKPNGLPEAFTIARDFLDGSKSVLILGDNLLIGQGLGTTLESHLEREGASVLAFPVNNPSEYGVVEFDGEGRVISLEEKPSKPKSHFAVPGLYFFDEHAPEFASKLVPSPRGELEITDLLRLYLKAGNLHVTTVRRGTGWMDAGTTESLYAASELVRVLQNRQGYRFNVPEEIAFNFGWITKSQLLEAAKKYSATSYGDYLSVISETQEISKLN